MAITGKELIKVLKEIYGVRTNSALAEILFGDSTSTNIGKWESGTVSKTVIKNVLSKVLNKGSERIRGDIFIDSFKEKHKKRTNVEISQLLGLSQASLNSWRRNGITIRALIGVIQKSKDLHTKNLINPITEFREITRTHTSHRVNYEIIDKSTEVLKNLKLHLDNCNGIYIFHDSRGNAVYVGKAKNQTLWKEINLAFNRDRSSQVMKKVSHSKMGSVGQITKHNVHLHDIAVYFSAYEVDKNLIDNLEATIIRMFPNDLLNARIERVKRAKK